MEPEFWCQDRQNPLRLLLQGPPFSLDVTRSSLSLLDSYKRTECDLFRFFLSRDIIPGNPPTLLHGSVCCCCSFPEQKCIMHGLLTQERTTGSFQFGAIGKATIFICKMSCKRKLCFGGGMHRHPWMTAVCLQENKPGSLPTGNRRYVSWSRQHLALPLFSISAILIGL